MITAEAAVRGLRRDMTLAVALKAAGFAAVVAGAFAASSVGIPPWIVVLLTLAVGVPVGLRRLRGTHLAADSPALIARGEYDEAERQIERVLNSFGLFRSVKLLGVHHLAALRHAQKRWGDAALLSSALLRQRLGGLPGVARTARLLLADSLLELGDLPGTHAALTDLHAQTLTLAEAMTLLVVQLDYEARVAAWPAMLANVGRKVQLAELMPAGPSARVQALLALAAVRAGNADLAGWLRRRVELLTDVDALVARRPILSPVFGGADRTGDPPPP